MVLRKINELQSFIPVYCHVTGFLIQLSVNLLLVAEALFLVKFSTYCNVIVSSGSMN